MGDESKEKLAYGKFDNFIEEPWILIKSYFEKNYLRQLVKHQLDSYNYLYFTFFSTNGELVRF